MARATKRRYEIEIGETGAKGAKRSISSLDDALWSFGKSALAVAGIGGGIAVLSDKLLELGKRGGAIQDVERAFKSLSEQPGILLESYRDAVDGIISDTELMKKAVTANLLSLPMDRFGDMLKIARAAAEGTGESMEFMLNSIVTGLGRGSSQFLDNVGIVLKATEAQAKFAASLKVTSSDLTEMQKKQAFAEEALRLGIQNLDKLGGDAESAAEGVNQLAASWDNLMDAIAVRAAPVVDPAAGLTAGVLNFTAGEIRERGILMATIFDPLNRAIQGLLGININTDEWFPDFVTPPDTGAPFNAGADQSLLESWKTRLRISKELTDQVLLRQVLTSEQEDLPTDEDFGFMTPLEMKLINQEFERMVQNRTFLADAPPFISPEDQARFDAFKGVAQQLSTSLGQAVVHGQAFGPAVAASLKTIATQLIAQAVIYGAFAFLFPGATQGITFGQSLLSGLRGGVGAGFNPLSGPSVLGRTFTPVNLNLTSEATSQLNLEVINVAGTGN